VAPESIAIVGASDNPKSLGGNVTRNVLTHSNFSGRVHLITDRHQEVLGHPTAPSLDALQDDVDVVLVLVPRQQVPGVLSAAQKRGAGFAVVMSAGFAEAGDTVGQELDAEIRNIVNAGSMRLVGPNCPGIGDLIRPLGLTIQPGFKDELRSGPVGVVAQSGGLTRCILQASHRGVGFSYFFAAGNQLDLDIPDFVNFLLDDPQTTTIALAVEHFPASERFSAVARRAREIGKPIVLLKTGVSEAGQAAAASHTGAIVGSRAALEAVARRHGVVLVDDVNHLITVAAHLSRGKSPRSNKALVFGMSGGSAVVLTDALAREGIDLAALSKETVDQLDALLPASVPRENPLDLAGASFGGESFRQALRSAAQAEEVGAVFVIFNAWYEGHTARFVEACLEIAPEIDIPLIPVWMSPRESAELGQLEQNGLMACRSAGDAAVVARRLLDATVPGRVLPETFAVHSPTLDGYVGRGTEEILLEDVAKEALAEAGVRTTREELVATSDDARAAANRLSFPVIMKVVHPSATHRAGTDLVTAAIWTEEQLTVAWDRLDRAAVDHGIELRGPHVLVSEFVVGDIEAYIGVAQDAEWGTVLSFGLGGRWIEELGDTAVIPVPTTAAEVVDVLRQSKLAHAMDRLGTSKSARQALVDSVVRVSHFAANYPQVTELDLNPVILTSDAAVAVDALIRLR
jgi:acyl-CoA synthetase (NDP forming)